MAIEKMVLLKIVGSLRDKHDILKKLILSENVHLSVDESESYDNSYMIHQYESGMTGSYTYVPEDNDETESKCNEMEKQIGRISTGADIKLNVDKSLIADVKYNLDDAYNDLQSIKQMMGVVLEEINLKKEEISRLTKFKEKINCVEYKNIEFDQIANLNYFDYEIGSLTRDNKVRIKKNYENISAIVLRMGILKSSVEDMYMIIYPKQFKEETAKLLKSLNWQRLKIPEGITGNSSNMTEQADAKIAQLENEISELSGVIEKNKESNTTALNKIYTDLKLEKTILGLKRGISYGENIFVISAWVKRSDRTKVEDEIKSVTDRYMITAKTAEEINKNIMPPTKFKNNAFTKPFEMIVKLYGLPSYYEIDPTPFLAITFCLMFGIMFGDIGQGLVYFVAGLMIKKKMESAGQILTRLGLSSVAFGFVYGSFFGLEQAELPWLPSLIGRPLDPKNIPMILLTGVIFGVVVLTVSFLFGIINCMRKKDIENGIFGKNGVCGYIFFMSLVMSAVAVTGVINLSVKIPLVTLVCSMILMILKEPLSNLVMGKKPLIHGSKGSYFTESIFEGVETILNALSNAISFIRIGAFALNHAGLFLAFLVMSEMTSNIFLKVIILVLGNVLILTLEGLVVFIQGLRLQYYEMFSKYFKGDGVEYSPVVIKN